VKVYLSRKYGFSATHRLHAAGLSDEENKTVYGKCNNPNGHGHNYEVEVTVAGPVDEVTGRVVDLAALDALVASEVVDPLRYRNLNAEIAAFRTEVPTTENLTFEVHRRLLEAWPRFFSPEKLQLREIRIWETERNICRFGAALRDEWGRNAGAGKTL
jgi:6-pyruvoyltetrahydropterin/6-carboxytetrahydropterin synthase